MQISTYKERNASWLWFFSHWYFSSKDMKPLSVLTLQIWKPCLQLYCQIHLEIDGMQNKSSYSHSQKGWTLLARILMMTMIDWLIITYYYCTDAVGTLRLGKAFSFISPPSPNKLLSLLWGHPNIAMLMCCCSGLSPAFPGGLLVFISSYHLCSLEQRMVYLLF